MVYQVAKLFSVTTRVIEETYSYEECLKWSHIAMYDGYTERKQYEG